MDIGAISKFSWKSKLNPVGATYVGAPTYKSVGHAEYKKKPDGSTQAMLTEFQANAGTDYDVPDCHDMLDLLRRDLKK